MALSARSRTLLTWLPAAVLVLAIGLAVFITFAVQNSWWAEEDPTASADQKASDGSSMLTDAGFDYVNVEGIVRVRIGEGALPVEELGLGSDADKSAEFRRPVRAVIAAGDEVYVVDDIAALNAQSEGGRLVSITLTYDNPGNWASAIDRIRGLAPTVGWTDAQIDELDDGLAAFNQEETDDLFIAQIGPSEGEARVTGRLNLDGASGITAVTVTFEPAA